MPRLARYRQKVPRIGENSETKLKSIPNPLRVSKSLVTMLQPALTEIFGPNPGWNDTSWIGSLESVEKHIRDTFDGLPTSESQNDDRFGRVGANVVRFDVSTRLGAFSVSEDRLKLTAAGQAFSTVKGNVAVYAGKWMYELQLASKGLMQVGWCSVACKFSEERGVGDTINSYAFDGSRSRKWNISTQSYGQFCHTGDIVGCAIDLDNRVISFHRNGEALGVAFEHLPPLAYFPAVSLALGESLTANFGSTPFKYPLQGFEPLQSVPVQCSMRSEKTVRWLTSVVKLASCEQHLRLRSYFVCLLAVVLRVHGSFTSVPYVLESIWIPFFKAIVKDKRTMHTCLDLMRCVVAKREMETLLESLTMALLREFRHVSSLKEYERQAESLKVLKAVCEHVESRRVLMDGLMFERGTIFEFLDAKAPDKSGLAEIVGDDEVWWDTNGLDEEIEGRKEKYLGACEKLSTIYSELEELQVDVLRELLDNSDGNEKRMSSRRIFLSKFTESIARIIGNPAPITFVCLCRLLAAFHSIWHEEIGTETVYVPCRVFYDGSIDFSRHERLGGVFSHLSKLLSNQISTANSSKTSPENLTSKLEILPKTDADSNHLYSLLNVLILFYDRAAIRSLAKITELLKTTRNYVSVYQQLKSRLNSTKVEPNLQISTELQRSLTVIHEKLVERSRHAIWIQAAVFNPQNDQRFAYFLTAISKTFIEASGEGDLLQLLPDFYLQTLADLCFAFRERLSDDSLSGVAEFLCDWFYDPRIVNVNSQSCVTLMLARFVFEERELRWLEEVKEEKRQRLVERLVKAVREKSWAEPNWILMRFWQGNGFAFRYERSPHLERRLSRRTEDGKGNRGPCPSPTFQNHLRHFLSTNPRETAMFLNKLLDCLNWTFSEFVEMMQDIDVVSWKSFRVPSDANQLKKCDTCFDLTVALLRVLEMILTLLPDIFAQGTFDNFLFRLCQLLCQILNRICSRTSCFERVLRLRIPELESVDHFPILTAVTGVFLALFKEEIAAFDRKVGKIAETLLTEASFQMSTIHFLLADSSQQFSLLSYPDHVTEDEIDEARRFVDHLEDQRRRILAKSTTSTENGNDSCTICYAQPIAVTFKPCNHQTCNICIDRHLLTNRTCFFCKATIETVVDLSGNVLHQFSS